MVQAEEFDDWPGRMAWPGRTATRGAFGWLSNQADRGYRGPSRRIDRRSAPDDAHDVDCGRYHLGDTDSTPFQAVVDNGNHLNLLPTPIAEAVNNAFSPPGVFDAESHVYTVDCKATTPEFGVVLDGQTSWHQNENLVYRHVDGSCFSSNATTAEDDGVGFNFLGDAFLRNVVSVLDFGGNRCASVA